MQILLFIFNILFFLLYTSGCFSMLYSENKKDVYTAILGFLIVAPGIFLNILYIWNN